MFDKKVIVKYTVLHVAELVAVVLVLILARNYFTVPTWFMVAVPAAWTIKDLVLFPKVWRAYAVDDNRPTQQLIGLEATVVAGLNPVGYVRVRGELWRAEIRDSRFPTRRGDTAVVVDVKGMTLIVERNAAR